MDMWRLRLLDVVVFIVFVSTIRFGCIYAGSFVFKFVKDLSVSIYLGLEESCGTFTFIECLPNPLVTFFEENTFLRLPFVETMFNNLIINRFCLVLIKPSCALLIQTYS